MARKPNVCRTQKLRLTHIPFSLKKHKLCLSDGETLEHRPALCFYTCKDLCSYELEKNYIAITSSGTFQSRNCSTLAGVPGGCWQVCYDLL